MNARHSRRDPRVFCGAPGRIEGPKGSIKGIVRNLSRGGFFFLSSTLIPVGKSIEMRIDLPGGQRVTVIGEVRYHHRYADGDGMGVRFIRLTGEDLSSIARFVDARASNA